MKRKLFIILSLFLMSSIYIFAENFPQKAKTIDDFIPKGWKRISSTNGDLNKDKLEDAAIVIEKNSAMNYMSALEHKRWSNFYYMKNFVYSEKKDEVNCTHNSLIDDWDEFLHSDKREEVIYDFISVLSVK